MTHTLLTKENMWWYWWGCPRNAFRDSEVPDTVLPKRRSGPVKWTDHDNTSVTHPRLFSPVYVPDPTHWGQPPEYYKYTIVLPVHWGLCSWKHVVHTVIGILPRETPDTLHGIGEDRGGEVLITQICLNRWESFPYCLKLHPRNSTTCPKGHHHWVVVMQRPRLRMVMKVVTLALFLCHSGHLWTPVSV